MAEAALNALALSPEQCLIIGDSLESDISLGKQAGMLTALVLSGSLTREEAEASQIKPDIVWQSLADLNALMTAEAK